MSTREPGLYEGLSNAEYQADDSLSASGMKDILKAPKLFKFRRQNPEFADALDFGSAYHAIVLDDETDKVVVVPFDEWRTTEAKALRDEARAEGKYPIKPRQRAQIDDMLTELRSVPEICELLDAPGPVEQSAFWVDELSGVPVRARFDKWSEPNRMVDLKSAADADPSDWARPVRARSYHISAAHYLEAARVFGLHPRPTFHFIAQEKEPPYLAAVTHLDAEALAVGEVLVRKAITTYAHCVKTDTWPGLPQNLPVNLPDWYVGQHIESETA